MPSVPLNSQEASESGTKRGSACTQVAHAVRSRQVGLTNPAQQGISLLRV